MSCEAEAQALSRPQDNRAAEIMFATGAFFQHCKRIAEDTMTNAVIAACREKCVAQRPIAPSPIVILSLITAFSGKSLMTG